MSNIFRDRSEGTNAKRQDLLRRRRDEFITMPHAIRRVFVARRARITASIAVCITGAALLVTAMTPSLAKFISSGMPGLNPAVLSTMVIAMWVTGIVAYTLSRAMGEHAFMVMMSRYVMPSEDVDNDVERLEHEHPDEIARGMAHRLEVRSAALPILAAGLLLPVTAVYAWQGFHAGGWPVIADFEANIATHPGSFVMAAIAGAIACVVMTKRFARIPRVAPLATVLAVGFSVAALMMRDAFPAGVVALLAASIAFVVWRLRKERDLLDTEDPAAGSEVFTVRGFIREVRVVLDKGRQVVRRATVKQLGVLAAVAFVGAGILAAMTGSSTTTGAMFGGDKANIKKPLLALPQIVTPSGTSSSKYKIEQLGNGSLRVNVTLEDDQPLDVAFPGVVTVPHGWTARVQLFVESQDGTVSLSAFPGDMTTPMKELTTERETSFSLSACDEVGHPLGLRVQSAKPGHYIYLITPVLELAGC